MLVLNVITECVNGVERYHRVCVNGVECYHRDQLNDVSLFTMSRPFTIVYLAVI